MRRALPNDPNDFCTRFAAESLKRCPLCGAVNSRSNEDCFLCGWEGRFDYDPASIQDGLNELVERCPELAALMSAPEPPKPTWMGRLKAQINRRLFRRKLDIWV